MPSARVRHPARPALRVLESGNITNIPFHEGLGFRVTGEIRLPDGGPTSWPMWRDPAHADDRSPG
ncbi:hypothetical protein ACFYNW_06510 [Streptomyces virginiae]|uniref:hypothetical protein n=1 Tax=Streptomyces virginiae TaxID=1961 RepID=UPI0036E58040